MNASKLIRSISILIIGIFFSAPIFANTDRQISTDVRHKIERDQSLAGAGVVVDIDTKNQVVSLTGVVNSDSQASTLVELAESTPGVEDVDTSNLTVKDSKQPLTDTFITAKVKGKFIREKMFGSTDISPMTISVETKNGVVYLTGKASTKEEVKNAVKIAQSVSGVKNVRYRIELTKGEIINLEGID